MYMPFLGLEAIDHQGKSALAKDLEYAISELQKKNNVGMNDIENSKINKIITDHTNIKNRVTVKPGYNGRLVYEPATKNHIFLEDFTRDYFEDMVAGAELVDKGGFRGKIDLKSGKVYGDFANVFVQIEIGEEYIRKNSIFTPAEAAAILLHEVGHAETNFEMLSRYTRTNFYMEAATRRILNCETKEQRIQILGQLENLYGEHFDDMERIAEVKKHKDYYRTVFLSLASRESISQLGYNVYDIRACEQLADQFVSRHGMGRDLATALDKLHRLGMDRVYMNSFLHKIIWIFEMLTSIFFGVITFGLSTLLLSSLNENKYDPIPRRIEKIKQNAVDYLKDKNLSKIEKERTIADIDILDKTLSEMSDNKSFYEFLWNKVFPTGRAENKQIIFNEELERMLNNSLFTSSAILRT